MRRQRVVEVHGLERVLLVSERHACRVKLLLTLSGASWDVVEVDQSLRVDEILVQADDFDELAGLLLLAVIEAVEA